MIIIRLITLLMMLFIVGLLIIIFKQSFYDRITNFLLKSKISTRISIFISNVHDSLARLPKLPLFFSAAPLIITIQICVFINVYLLFKVLGVEIPIVNHLAIVPVIQIVSLVPFTLSGLGIREGAFVYFYGFLGVKPEIAFTVSILNFLIMNGIPAVIGGIVTISTQIRKSRTL